MHACRALGDADYKDPKPFVSAEASVRRLDLLPEDKAVIIASDGLWDVIGDQDVVTMVDQLIKVCVVNESLPVVMHTSPLGCQVAHRICLYGILSKMCLCYTLCFGLQMHAYAACVESQQFELPATAVLRVFDPMQVSDHLCESLLGWVCRKVRARVTSPILLIVQPRSLCRLHCRGALQTMSQLLSCCLTGHSRL